MTVVSIGSRLGPYEILSLIGAGGMGEVYRARDTRLGREVAVKVLSQALATDPGSMARFEREARAIAALSHPNIVAVYDIGSDPASPYVVTELLDGATLRERLEEGPLPVRKAIEYARQIAQALSAAHDRGVVHRDIKPDNLFVTPDGRVKVLDFGLANVSAPITGDGHSLAATVAHTTPGAVFGTVGYMAPEQVRGQAVDHRADIFALGAVLYEMLTGRRAFDAGTAADSISALLSADPPPMTRADAAVPPHLERLVHRCLEKSPQERFQSARDLAFALDTDAAAVAAPGARTWRWDWRTAAATGLVALVLAGLAAMALLASRNAAAPAGPGAAVRFGIPASTTWLDGVSVSPDGRYVVFTGGTSTSGRFWLRRLDALDAEALSDTDSAHPLFFWSPDSRTLGYRAGNAIVVREIPGGSPRVLAELKAPMLGASWGALGDLVVATSGGLYRMNSAGGALTQVSRAEPGRELWRGAPSFLPDGRRFVFSVLMRGDNEQSLETRVADLDGRELGTVGTGLVGASYADGQLLFGAGGALFTQPFDVERLALTGERVRLAESITQDWRSGYLGARLSNSGVLVYRAAPRANDQFTIVDRSGRVVRAVGAPGSYISFSLSPDERRIIATRRDPVSSQASLWVIDVARGVTSLATDRNDSLDANDPTWSPDGQQIAFRHGGKLVLRAADGGAERTLLDAEAYPESFSSDGRVLIYGQPTGNNLYETFAVDVLTPGARPIALVTGVTLADEGHISPNGRWVAYHSNETGTAQVSVVPFPPTGQRWQLSQAGGVQPRWSADGNELYYLGPEGRLMAVRVPGGDPRGAGAAEPLFVTGVVPSDALDQFAPMRNGFLVRMPVSVTADAAAVEVVVNWKERR